MANTTQIDLFCNGLIGVRPVIEPSQKQLLAWMVSAAALGHTTVIEKLLQQKADVNQRVGLSTGQEKGWPRYWMYDFDSHQGVIECI